MAVFMSATSPPIMELAMASLSALTFAVTWLNDPRSLPRSMSMCSSTVLDANCSAPASLSGCVFWSNPTRRPYWRTMDWKNAS